ncbi:hypothetical protein KCV04_g13196, partial [Aureobasidium melanogenum]
KNFIKAEEEEKNPSLSALVPEGKKRKFILVDDLARGTRVRVHVELDNIKLEEMPDFHLQKNSVYPRQFYPRQMHAPSPGQKHLERHGLESKSENESMISEGESLVDVPLSDGSQTQLSVPEISKDLQAKECALNELGYRMSWRQAKTFNERTMFMQKSLDAYRDKTWSAIVASGQTDPCLASHFEIRTGKRRWLGLPCKEEQMHTGHNRRRTSASMLAVP